MEDLAPSLRLVLWLREGMERGESLRFCLSKFLEEESPIKMKLLQLGHFETDSEFAAFLRRKDLKNSERSVFGVIQRGLRGEPISGILRDLELDLVERSENEMDEFTQKLGFRCLIPLLLLIFPGYLFLLVGPLIERLLASFQ